MPATAAIPAQRSLTYEDWRPPIVGVALLVPVGADSLAVADLRGMLMLPVGDVRIGHPLEEAAQQVLASREGLPLLRRVAVDRVQTRRRKVITHVLASAPMTRAAVDGLAYRDPRADVRVMSTLQFIDEVWPKARLRILVGLQALATGETVCIENGVVRAGIPVELMP
ncbi:hypothetical protein GCM10010251_58950 [Streptomyces aurantiogriseus]|uniref:Uncharacterized protein n=2 Tax=Streptomyces aurantiogriseus TaxID=66870 RepID=A0A918KV81_9ACTN|nr:hypothetical protein GCM10010251_58950 [Streptomyces aurantiogriseus]